MPYGTDPFVFKEGNQWYKGMGGHRSVDGRSQGCFSLYKSEDLINWKFAGIPHATNTRAWEESDFFRLRDKWVVVCEPFGPSQYYTGTFDPETCEFTEEYHGYLDYAGVANHDPQQHLMKYFTGQFIACTSAVDDRGRRVCVGLVPTAVSLPRVLSLRSDGRISQKPLPELSKLRRDHLGKSAFVLNQEPQRFDQIQSDLLEIKIEFDPETSQEFGLKVRCSKDGSRFVRIACDGEFLEVAEDKTPARLMDGEETLRLHLFLDRNSLEFFANDWVVYTESMSAFPTDLDIELFSTGGTTTVKHLDIWELASIGEKHVRDSDKSHGENND